METFDEVRNFWNENTNLPSGSMSVNGEKFRQVIKFRIKKEKRNISEYFWLSLSYQILIYSFACHLIVRFWGDIQILALSGIGILLYAPLTIILMRKFKSMLIQREIDGKDVQSGVRHQHEMLGQFFRFKKRFDMVALPITSVILAAIIFKLYVPGGLEEHFTGAIILSAVMLIIYGVAAWFENRKHFVKPLRRLTFILEDMGKNG